ncbi:hypothetical protein WMW72_23225 [Paenibacillus filicis]|uniref:HEAT repeat domain-containing protein n=1 Tax=Paenibacillus filicis TaxID=669464 RepID=A0ABU9DPM9_9BACL
MEKKTKESLVKLQDYFTYLQTYIDSEAPLQLPHFQLNQHERRVVQKKLIELIECLKGTHREKLTKLCEDMQLVRRDLHRLQSPLPWIKVDAIYHLGAMRSDQAVSGLMNTLKSNKYGPNAFIVARSIAQCASEVEHLREMVQLVVRYGKNFHSLVADIITESEMDCTPFMLKFLNQEDSDSVHIALAGLPAHVVPSQAPRLYRLLGSGNQEIRMKAGKLLYSDNYAMVQDDEKQVDDHLRTQTGRLLRNKRQQQASHRLSRNEPYTKSAQS